MTGRPEIETERLLLRAHSVDDFPHSAAMWADPVVTRHIGGRTFSTEESWARVLRYIGHWEALGFGYWVVEEKTTGHFVGEAGFGEFKREIEPRIDGLPEMGWAFVSRVHGQGYATEAVRAVAAWGDRHLNAPRTVCLIHPENQASLRVAEKCGFEEYRRTEYKGQPTILLARQKVA
ncbi:MAG TPA: GNAT family N-acetyltransferase [Bryobacteraceae bacterium]